MKSRTKLTPFARFFLFLVIILPLAYVGAAYFNGEDPIAKIKGMVNKEGGEEETAKLSSESSSSSYREINRLKDKVKNLEEENKKLKADIKKLEDAKPATKWGK